MLVKAPGRYEFQKKKAGFVVCFYRSEEKADKKPIRADKKPIKAERQEKIVEFVKTHGTINNKEARDLLGLADSTTKRILKEMVEEFVSETVSTASLLLYSSYGI